MRAVCTKCGSSVAKTASPSEPPIWRKSELSPVASVMRKRGMLASATVVSGTKMSANPNPCRMIAATTEWLLVSSV